MPAQRRKSVPSRTPGMVRVRDSASRSRLQSPSRKRNEAGARKASDRSRLQAPKSAASKARSKAAMKKRFMDLYPERRLTMSEPARPERFEAQGKQRTKLKQMSPPRQRR